KNPLGTRLRSSVRFHTSQIGHLPQALSSCEVDVKLPPPDQFRQNLLACEFAVQGLVHVLVHRALGDDVEIAAGARLPCPMDAVLGLLMDVCGPFSRVKYGCARGVERHAYT